MYQRYQVSWVYSTYLIHRLLVQKSNQIPQNIAVWCLNQTCSLSNAELTNDKPRMSVFLSRAASSMLYLTFGSVHTSSTFSFCPLAHGSKTFLYLLSDALRFASVVNDWPVSGMNCRGSWSPAHCQFGQYITKVYTLNNNTRGLGLLWHPKVRHCTYLANSTFGQSGCVLFFHVILGSAGRADEEIVGCAESRLWRGDGWRGGHGCWNR